MLRLSFLLLTTSLIVVAAASARADELMLDEPPATGQTMPSVNPLSPSPAAHSIIAGAQPGDVVPRDVGAVPAAMPVVEPLPVTPSILSTQTRVARGPADQRPLGNEKPPVMAPESGYDPILNLSENDARAEFAAMDKDHDGIVTYEEFAQTYAWYYPLNDDPTQMPKRYDALGGDEQGHLTLGTFIANRNKAYDDDLTMRYVPDGPRGDD